MSTTRFGVDTCPFPGPVYLAPAAGEQAPALLPQAVGRGQSDHQLAQAVTQPRPRRPGVYRGQYFIFMFHRNKFLSARQDPAVMDKAPVRDGQVNCTPFSPTRSHRDGPLPGRD